MAEASGAWALLNLIMGALTALGSVVMLARYIGKKRDEEDNQQTGQQIPQFGSVPAPQDNGLSVSDLGEFEEILSDGDNIPF
jgi:hypothetical protein